MVKLQRGTLYEQFSYGLLSVARNGCFGPNSDRFPGMAVVTKHPSQTF